MRTPLRSAAAILTTFLVTAALGCWFISPASAEGEDRTDSQAYTDARADYWAARAAYAARKAATQARKDGVDDSPTTTAPPPDTSKSASSEEAPAPAPLVSGSPTDSQLAALRMCESTDNYGINSGNGYYGAYQFSAITWWWLGYTGYPNQASAATQDEAVRALYAIYGWSPWPACSRYLGFR